MADSSSGLDSSLISVDGSASVGFGTLDSGLLTGTAANLVFTATSGADVIRLRAGPSPGQLIVSADNGSFDSLSLTAPTGSLTLNAGAGDDVIIIDDLGPGFMPGLVGSGAPQLLLTFGLAMVADLRNAGIRAEVYLGNPKNFGNQLKYADKRQSPVAVIQGGNEADKGTVILKDLILGAQIAQNATLEEWKDRPAQVEIARADLVAEVRKMLGQ